MTLPEMTRTDIPPADGGILLCAATRWEARPIARELGLSVSGINAFTGLIQGKTVTLIQTGMGPQSAERALSGLPTAGINPGIVVSAGFAGALKPNIRPGDIIVDAPISCAPAPRPRGLSIHFGRIVSVESVASAAQKHDLGSRSDALAVDMETGAIKAWAGRRSVPAVAARVILDAIDENIPSHPAGDDAGSLAFFAIKNWKDLPRLAALGVRQKRAMKGLAAFLEDFLRCL
ncbi:MAG: phosphorylase family protein [Elusimicrobiota bacterium]